MCIHVCGPHGEREVMSSGSLVVLQTTGMEKKSILRKIVTLPIKNWFTNLKNSLFVFFNEARTHVWLTVSHQTISGDTHHDSILMNADKLHFSPLNWNWIELSSTYRFPPLLQTMWLHDRWSATVFVNILRFNFERKHNVEKKNRINGIHLIFPFTKKKNPENLGRTICVLQSNWTPLVFFVFFLSSSRWRHSMASYLRDGQHLMTFYQDMQLCFPIKSCQTQLW